MAGVRAITVVALAAIFLLLVGPPMFAHPPTLYTGVHFHRTGAPVQREIADVDRWSPAYRAGLRSGDAFSCLSRLDHELLFAPDLLGYAAGYAARTPIRVCVQRPQGVLDVRFVAVARPPVRSVYGNDAIAALRLVEYAIFLLCGIALVLGRPGVMTWTFFAYCLFSLPNIAVSLNTTYLPSHLYALYEGILVVLGASASGFLLLFALLVPDDKPKQSWRLWGLWVAGSATAALIALVTFAFTQTDWQIANATLGTIGHTFATATVLVVLARLATMQRHERARFGWAAFAIIWGAVTNNLRSVAVLPGSAGTIAAMLTVVMPIALMYAILRRHVIDVRFVISRTVVYATITTVVVGLIGAVDWAASAYLHEARAAMAVEALVTIGLGFVLHRTYRWLEYAVDFFLFRHKYEAETYLRRLAKTLRVAQREDAVDNALVHDPYEKFDLTAAALFRPRGSSYVPIRVVGWSELDTPPFDRDHDVVRFLLTERTRLSIGDLRAYVAAPFREHGGSPAVAIPIFQGDWLIAFVLYGIHRSGTKLDPDEVETLEHLCESAAQAYTGIELARYQNIAPTTLAPSSS